MRNLPAWHQQSLTPATSRASPAFDPANGSTRDGDSSRGGETMVAASRWQPISAKTSSNATCSVRAIGSCSRLLLRVLLQPRLKLVFELRLEDARDVVGVVDLDD